MGLKYEAKARLKSVYSIWRKMETKHVPFEEVYDLYAMRIIFECDDQAKEKAICWQIYSAITDIYRLHPSVRATGSAIKGQRISGTASYGNGARRQLDRGADTLAPHGRDSRARFCRPLEI